jgi:hypothetical protein
MLISRSSHKSNKFSLNVNRTTKISLFSMTKRGNKAYFFSVTIFKSATFGVLICSYNKPKYEPNNM